MSHMFTVGVLREAPDRETPSTERIPPPYPPIPPYTYAFKSLLDVPRCEGDAASTGVSEWFGDGVSRQTIDEHMK